MKNYVIEMMAERNFTVKANTPEEALDFIIHACFNSNIISLSSQLNQHPYHKYPK